MRIPLCSVTGGYQGGQAEYLRVPFADATHIKVPRHLPDEKVVFLSDILPTGWQAAVQCEIEPTDTVAVWGAGPLGQMTIRSAILLGAKQPVDERRRMSSRVDDVLPRGAAITRSTIDPAKGVPAVGDVLGFMIDPTVVSGPTAEQRGQLWGKELSLPDVAGDVVTLDPPYDAYECEGPQHICLSGTGAIDNTTARGTKCSYNDGVLRVAQESDIARYRISDNSGLSGSEVKADGDGPRLYLEIIN